MVTAKDVILGQLQTGQFLLEGFTKDLSDAEYFKPAAPGTNHAAWVLGHIACTEDWGRWLISGGPKKLDEATHALFKGGSKCVPDASKYPARATLDTLFRESRAHLAEALKVFDDSKWETPTPEHGPKAIGRFQGGWQMGECHAAEHHNGSPLP